MFYLEKNEKDFSSKPELLMGNSFRILFSLKWRKVSCGGLALMTSCNQGGDIVYFVGAGNSKCLSKYAFQCFWLKKLKNRTKIKKFWRNLEKNKFYEFAPKCWLMVWCSVTTSKIKILQNNKLVQQKSVTTIMAIALSFTCEKSIFWPAFGVRSTQTLAEYTTTGAFPVKLPFRVIESWGSNMHDVK